MHSRGEFGVGQHGTGIDDRDSIRMCPDGLGEQFRKQCGRTDLTRGVVPFADLAMRLECIDQRDITDRAIRIGQHRRQDAIQALGEARDRGFVEKVQRIGELGGHPRHIAVGVGRLLQGQLQIEFRGAGVVVDTVDRQPGQFQAGLTNVLERQHHLEQGMARLRTRRIEHLDQPLEGHIGMRECLQIGIARLGQ